MADATFLDRIVAATRQRLIERQARHPLTDIEAIAQRQPPALDFATALRSTDGGIRTIAEIKRASPSKGILNAHLDVRSCAAGYVSSGAAAISVLTEEDFFQGSLDDLRAVRSSSYTHHTPLLRKDFITDPYQIIEARATGADSYLLIVALLDDATLHTFIEQGRQFGMEPLVEVHSKAEAIRAVAAGATIIGVNARDLRTFTVDTTILQRVREVIPLTITIVAESGISTRNDVIRMRGYGAQAILVGEALVREHGHTTIDALTYIPDVLRMTPPTTTPFVKLCGMRSLADAKAAVAAGADAVGFVFVESKRQVTPETAQAFINELPATILTVGVFADTPLYAIESIAKQAGFKIAQLAVNDDGTHYLDQLDMPKIVAVPAIGVYHQPKYTLVGYDNLPLLDAKLPGEWGGTGQLADWDIATDWAYEFPILLAGGLNPDNVAEAIARVHPWGVDVSSGIEGPDGKKDPGRMRAFVQAAKGY